MTTDSLVSAVPLPVPISFAKLFKTAFDGGDLKPLREELLAGTYADTIELAAALISLSTIEQLLGERASGLTHQADALRRHRLYQSSWPTSANPLRVVAFKAAGDVSTNTPIE